MYVVLDRALPHIGDGMIGPDYRRCHRQVPSTR
jgi:DNA gyrase/topoisomerase IV subunit A